jgi:flavin-dependent thymidylate synthase
MNNEVQKWADEAMYASEPLDASTGPRVYLLEMSHDPLGQIAAACLMYKGKVVRSLADVTDDERRYFFKEVQNTKLKAPFEFVKFHFLIEGVTRSLTHQMVRQRTAVYAQESLRFAVKENMAESVALPPSLAGARSMREIYDDAESNGWNWDLLPEVDRKRYQWGVVMQQTEQAYQKLVDTGMPAEDARGLLPHNITTRLHYSTDLRALQDHAGNRLCTQAQMEWRILWTRIIEAIRNYDPRAANAERLGGEDTSNWTPDMLPDRWQFEMLSDIFRPVCYLTGKCEFRANFDRYCKIRERVNANEQVGRSSSEWGEEYDSVEGNPIVSGVGPQSVVYGEGIRPVFIGAIQPAEWLLDPGAARRP